MIVDLIIYTEKIINFKVGVIVEEIIKNINIVIIILKNLEQIDKILMVIGDISRIGNDLEVVEIFNVRIIGHYYKMGINIHVEMDNYYVEGMMIREDI